MNRWTIIVILAVIGCSAPKTNVRLQSETTRQKLTPIATLARVTGYVRYFHPSAGVESMKWPLFVVKAVDRVKGAQNPKELAARLNSLFRPFTHGVSISPSEPDDPGDCTHPATPRFVWQHKGVRLNGTQDPGNQPIYESKRVKVEGGGPVDPLFAKIPACGETLTKDVGSGLYLSLPVSVPEKGDSTTGEPSPDPQDRAPPPSSPADVYTADVVQVWNVIQHFYPYFDVVGVDWQKTLHPFLQRAQKTTTDLEFYDLLRDLIEVIRDGHGHVYKRDLFPQPQRGLPVVFDRVDGRITVTRSLVDSLQPGDRIVKIAGIPAERRLKEIKGKISGSDQWKTRRALQGAFGFGWGPAGSKVTLTFERPGERSGRARTVELERTSGVIEEFERKDFFAVEPEVFYVNLDKVKIETIKSRIDELATARGVIFDLRGYPAGNHQVLQHLSDQTLKSAHFDTPQFIYPDQKRLAGHKEGNWVLSPAKPRISGEVVFITDSRAISYAESVLGIVEHYELGKIVAPTPTAGANGNVNSLITISGFRVNFTGMKVTKRDGSRHHLTGIHPTHPTRRSLGGVKERRDELLERALKLVRDTGQPPLSR